MTGGMRISWPFPDASGWGLHHSAMSLSRCHFWMFPVHIQISTQISHVTLLDCARVIWFMFSLSVIELIQYLSCQLCYAFLLCLFSPVHSRFQAVTFLWRLNCYQYQGYCDLGLSFNVFPSKLKRNKRKRKKQTPCFLLITVKDKVQDATKCPQAFPCTLITKSSHTKYIQQDQIRCQDEATTTDCLWYCTME